MKTLLIILVSITLSVAVSAQRKGFYRPYPSYHSRVYISPFSYGIGFGYPYYGYPYYGYPPYDYPYYGNRRMPYKLSLEIESIKADYKDQIRDTRKDKSLSHSQRRQEIRSLKAERDKEITNAQRNFFRSRRTNNQNPGIKNQEPDNSNPSS